MAQSALSRTNLISGQMMLYVPSTIISPNLMLTRKTWGLPANLRHFFQIVPFSVFSLRSSTNNNFLKNLKNTCFRLDFYLLKDRYFLSWCHWQFDMLVSGVIQYFINSQDSWFLCNEEKYKYDWNTSFTFNDNSIFLILWIPLICGGQHVHQLKFNSKQDSLH